MEYKKIKILGKGSFGSVFLVRDNFQNNFALKVLENNELNILSFNNEVKFLNLLKNKNIVSINSAFKTRSTLNIVMEYINNGDLKNRIRLCRTNKKTFSDSEIKKIILSISNGINHLHLNNIIHRDLKPANILISKNNEYKIADFGISRLVNKDEWVMTNIGTPYYMAPEVFNFSGYTNSVDYWALGIILYELLVLKVPFTATNLKILQEKISKEYYSMNKVKISFRDIVKNLINVDKNNRYNYSDIIKFFNKKDEKEREVKLTLPKINNIYSRKQNYENLSLKPRIRLRDKSMIRLIEFYNNRKPFPY